MSHIADKIIAYTDKYHDFDFIIGSSHLVYGKDPYYPAYYEGRSEKEALLEYFESILANVQTFDNYSIYGHLDYAVRYCPSGEAAFRFSDYADVFEAILKTIIEHGVDYSQTVSCYQADDQGRACGKCDSCRLRKQGFVDAGVADPTRYIPS
jgi:HisJ family histidinol phosphate phosphatase